MVTESVWTGPWQQGFIGIMPEMDLHIHDIRHEKAAAIKMSSIDLAISGRMTYRQIPGLLLFLS